MYTSIGRGEEEEEEGGRRWRAEGPKGERGGRGGGKRSWKGDWEEEEEDSPWPSVDPDER